MIELRNLASPAWPLREAVVDHVRNAGRRYWPDRQTWSALDDDFRDRGPVDLDALGRSWRMVELPPWGAAVGVGNPSSLLVDCAVISPGEGPEYSRCDWTLAAFSHLAMCAERNLEAATGPLHSYSPHRSKVPSELYDYAWANRILLYIRSEAAVRNRRSPEEIFGPLPLGEIEMTHDVDALDKTAEIRFKQSAFEAFNVFRGVIRGDPGVALDAGRRGLRFLSTTPPYDDINTVCELEAEYGLRSVFHVYAGDEGKRNRLFDPGYSLDDPRLNILKRLSDRGWSIGLHGSYNSWQDPERLEAERTRLEALIGARVSRTRQHWLRFSLNETWAAQSEAGLQLDTTLGFNDRPGFRCGGALRFKPWNLRTNHPHSISALPLVLMDSHLYSYLPLRAAEREAKIKSVFEEVMAVGGEATILWHHHTLAPDYGWEPGFRYAVRALAGNGHRGGLAQ